MTIRGAALLLVVSVPLGCEYAGLLRPNVLKQLNPRVVRLVNFLPEVDRANEAMIGQLAGHGGLSHARVDRDGVMRADTRVSPDQFLWEPAIIVLPRAGELQLDVSNYDTRPHSALAASTGERQYVAVDPGTRARMSLRLERPGLYTFACAVGNHAGRGMLGFIIVRGDVAPEARLDRPPQPRP